MSNIETPQATDIGQSRDDMDDLGEHLANVARQLVNDYMQWLQGFQRWAQQMHMSFQPVPPQAWNEAMSRQQWLTGILTKLQPAGSILDQHDAPALSKLLKEYLSGFEKLSTAHTEMNQNMIAENARTSEAINQTFANITAESIKAAADRHKLQQETAAYVHQKAAEGIAARQESFGEMNDAVKEGLFGR